MKDIVILGAGKIGRMVTHMLATCGDYQVRVGDARADAAEKVAGRYDNASGHGVDFTSAADLDKVLSGAWAVLSCAPFHCNPLIAERAKAAGCNYLDLTEDVEVTRKVAEMAEGAKTAFAPQCGLAPGFITITANHLIKKMTDLHEVKLRVGALPRYPNNILKYNLTWSTAGLINEYCNPCEVILDGQFREVQPLENLENLTIDGVEYEAFNTSGGLGTFAASLDGKCRNVNYKSIRYPGHNHLLKVLLQDLGFKDHQDELGKVFDRALPGTFQDQIVIFVSATGMFEGRRTDNVYANTVYHQEIDGENWSGIQITTSAGICAVLDLMAEGTLPQEGFVRMEDVDYEQFITNRFGKYYA